LKFDPRFARSTSPLPLRRKCSRGHTQVAQDIRTIFLPNGGPILVTILDQYWSETLANVGPILALTNIGPILDRYRSTLDQYCTNIQPIWNQYYLPYLSFSRSPLPPLTAFYCYLKRCEIASASLCPWRPIWTQKMNDHRTIGDRSYQNDHDRSMITA